MKTLGIINQAPDGICVRFGGFVFDDQGNPVSFIKLLPGQPGYDDARYGLTFENCGGREVKASDYPLTFSELREQTAAL